MVVAPIRFYFAAANRCSGVVCAVVCLLLTGCPNPPASIKQARILAKKWKTPSADVSKEQFFKKRFGEFTLQKSQDCNRLDEFNFDAAGWHAEYQNDDEKIDFFLFREVNQEDLEQLRKTAMKQIHGDGPHRSLFSAGSGNWELNCPNGVGYRFFPKNGWLAIFKTREPFDSISFAESCLQSN